MKITKAVFPAAGFGTRFLPATKSQPKEMLPLIDKPVIQYLVEEAVASGIEQIIIVTGRGKRAIEDHFDASWELESVLNQKGQQKLLREIQNISKLAEFIYVRQPEPLGDGDAILHAKKLLKDEPFAILFGDSLIDGKIPATSQLIDAFQKANQTIVGVTPVEKEDISSYGIVSSRTGTSGQKVFEIESMIEKPKPEKAPSNLAIVGKYIVTPEIFEALEKAQKQDKKELRLIDGLRQLQKTQKVYGHKLDGAFYDTGDKFGMLKATIDFALKREDMNGKLKKYLQEKFKK
jgi:UTP--glucose-1-phosphate uridylyltransferase